ncbi:hypothetical protein KJ912_01075 [Patescibacteria group bacterium]|nr:hypothetical protein [Patescibacteria group bacterium]
MQGENRFGEIRSAVREAQEAGISSARERREVVIKKVGKESLSQESPETKERAINKYWDVEAGSQESKVMFVIPHLKNPEAGEMVRLLREKFPGREPEELQEIIKKWLKAPENEKPHKFLSVENPDLMVYQAIDSLRDVDEPGTDAIVDWARENQERDLKSGKMVAKRSRMFGDANRKTFFNKSRGVGKEEEGTFIQTKEYPTSIRASWYWALEKELKRTGKLDDRGKLLEPFLQVTVHGMKDREIDDSGDAYDLVVGGGSLKSGKRKEFASDELKEWFSAELELKLAEKLGGEQNMKLAIDRRGKDKVELFEAGQDGRLNRREVKRLGQSFAASGVGLDNFRQGGNFLVQTSDGNEREMRIPGFGLNFNTIQLEVSAKIRKDPALRRALGEALGELACEFELKEFH